jgi:ADP-heptose:LPS heptosyltransferase
MRILALVPGGIGDQILFFPTIDDLKEHYPEAEIDVVVEPRSTAAYRVSKSVNKVISFDFVDTNGLADWGNLLGVIRDREYEVVIATGGRCGIGFLLWLSGIPKRIGSAKGVGKIFFSHPVEVALDRSQAEQYHDLLKGLDIDSPCPPVAINVPKGDIEWSLGEQQKLGIKDSGYVLIHPGTPKSSSGDNTYPVKQWQQIIKDLQTRQPNIPVVAVKSTDNEDLIKSLLEVCSNLKVIAPTDIGKLAATIAGANLMLCTEGDAMQLAAAVGTYTIALFGTNEPKKLLPDNGRAIGIRSLTGKISDIPPSDVLTKVWQG